LATFIAAIKYEETKGKGVWLWFEAVEVLREPIPTPTNLQPTQQKSSVQQESQEPTPKKSLVQQESREPTPKKSLVQKKSQGLFGDVKGRLTALYEDDDDGCLSGYGDYSPISSDDDTLISTH